MLDFSDGSGQVKIRLEKPVPCVFLRGLCHVCALELIRNFLFVDTNYILSGRQSYLVEVTDELIRPFSHEMPVYVRIRLVMLRSDNCPGASRIW